MKSLALFASLLVACVPPSEVPQNRWPHHRKQHDDELADLKIRVDALDRLTRQLRSELAKLQAPVEAPPPEAAR